MRATLLAVLPGANGWGKVGGLSMDPGGGNISSYIKIYIYIYNVCNQYRHHIFKHHECISRHHTYIIYIYFYSGTHIYLKRPETHIVSASTMISFNHCKRGGLMFFCRPRSGEKQQANIDPTKKSRKPSFATIYWKGGQPKSRWWFQMFYMFTPTWGNDPI